MQSSRRKNIRSRFTSHKYSSRQHPSETTSYFHLRILIGVATNVTIEEMKIITFFRKSLEKPESQSELPISQSQLKARAPKKMLVINRAETPLHR